MLNFLLLQGNPLHEIPLLLPLVCYYVLDEFSHIYLLPISFIDKLVWLFCGFEEARPAKMPLPSKQASCSNGRIPQNVRDDRRPSPIHGQRTSSMNGRRTSSMNGQRPPSINGQRPPSINGQTNGRAGPTKLSSTTKSNSMLAADQRQLHNNNRNGPGRPAMSNGLQQKKPVAITGKTSQVAKISTPVMSKPPAAKMPSPALKHNVQQRKDLGNPNKYKIAPRQPAASMRPQV